MTLSLYVLCIDGQYHEYLKTTDNRKSARITLKETTVIPPLGEIILQGVITEMPNFSEGLIEPNMKFLRYNRVVLAKAVIYMHQSMVPLRVLNLSDQSWGVQMVRWLEVVGTYNLEIQHRPSRQHGNADALSRRPCESCAYRERRESEEQKTTKS